MRTLVVHGFFNKPFFKIWKLSSIFQSLSLQWWMMKKYKGKLLMHGIGVGFNLSQLIKSENTWIREQIQVFKESLLDYDL